MKNNKVIYKIFHFIGTLCLISLIQVVVFWVTYLSLTSPVTSDYVGTIRFSLTLLMASIGSVIIQVKLIINTYKFILGEK